MVLVSIKLLDIWKSLKTVVRLLEFEHPGIATTRLVIALYDPVPLGFFWILIPLKLAALLPRIRLLRTCKSPATSRVYAGFDVPRPTLLDNIYKLLEVFVH